MVVLPPELLRPRTTGVENEPFQPTNPTASNYISSSGPAEPIYQTSGPSPRQTVNRMRSSIACIRCRRSKVKCVNDGVGTTCRSCQNAGRECTYPSPVAPGLRQRDSASVRSDGYGDSEARPRPKKRTHTSANNGSASGDSQGPVLDALDPRILTPNVWQELFDIFQIHYSADLPFLHPPTFLKPLRQASMQQMPTLGTPASASSNARPPMSQEFLLAFLALTARFHPKLVAHHSPPTSARPSNPLIASDYYAAAATERMSGLWNHDSQIQDIERTQAMLMLGLHEWGMCRGARAWVTVGVAIRSAQVMGLQYEMDLDDEPLSRSLALDAEAESISVSRPRGSISDPKYEGDAFIHQELRRRTFWSCYIMDRYLSSGKYRPQMLHAKEVRIQLPASEHSFLFGEKVRTLMLCEEEEGVAGRAEVQSLRRASVMLTTGNLPEPNTEPSPKTVMDYEEDKGRLEIGEDEGLVSRYIKILEIYGRVIKWSCSGGRRTEQHPPWDRRSEFSHLRKQCLDFKASLPRQHTLAPQNTQAHIIRKTSTPYMLIHTVYLLCQIMLHREYVPFIPLRSSKPEGPLDPPLFPPEKYDVPPGFWDDSARECFKSARDVIDLVRSCQEWSALVETPIVGFAIYNVAFAGVYAMNFPWMDPGAHLSTHISADDQKPDGSNLEDHSGFEASRKALEMIGQMRTKVKMADGWFRTINRMHQYFRRMKRDYRRNVAAIESSSESEPSPTSTRHLSLREGGLGGGLNEFRLLERTLHDFGNLEDQDIEMTDANQRPNSRPVDAAYDDNESYSGNTIKSDEAENRAGTSASRSEGGPWNAINAAPGSANSRTGSVSAASSGPFRPSQHYDQQNQQSQQPPQSWQQSDPHQVPNFRPAALVQGSQNGPHAPPSLTSPVSRTVSTPSQPSPPFYRPQQEYPGWNQHHTSYPLHPTPGSYGDGYPYQQQQPTSIQSVDAYSNPTHPQQQTIHHPAPIQEMHHPWNEVEKEAWLNSLHTGLGGDDYAAFANGGDMMEFAIMSANRGYGGAGWLSTVWEGAVTQ